MLTSSVWTGTGKTMVTVGRVRLFPTMIQSILVKSMVNEVTKANFRHPHWFSHFKRQFYTNLKNETVILSCIVAFNFFHATFPRKKDIMIGVGTLVNPSKALSVVLGGVHIPLNTPKKICLFSSFWAYIRLRTISGCRNMKLCIHL